VNQVIAQLTTSWGAPGWAVVACALISAVGTILMYRRDVKLKRMDIDAAARGADQATSNILFKELADLREQLGALKARVNELEHREKELNQLVDRQQQVIREQQASYNQLRLLSLNEINRLLADLNRPAIVQWPPPVVTTTTVVSTSAAGGA
jgi:TolA-binding protein